MGCRRSDGRNGSKSAGEIDIFKKVSREICERKCLGLEYECFGYENSSRRQKCEIWKVRIDGIKLKYENGQDCYIKD